MATEKKAAPKTAAKPVARRDPNRCRWYHGSYGSPQAADCKTAKVPGKQLCAEHETKWKVIARQRAAAKKAATPKAAVPVVVPLSTRRPAPHAEAVQRVAAFVAPQPTVTEIPKA